MAVTTYTKTKNEDFELDQLQIAVNTNPGIIPSLLSASSDGNQITFEFANHLTSPEEDVLDHLVAAHVPVLRAIPTTQLPVSDIDGKKLSVHLSYKPKTDKRNWATWTGAGDDIDDPSQVGNGEVLDFYMAPDKEIVSKEVRFHPDHGRVWIHEGYLKFIDGGIGDHLCADIVAMDTPVQTAVNLDLVLENNWIKFSTSGPGTGTHGFANPNQIVLIPREFSSDGDWDYDGANLTPNFTGNGGYKISNVERNVHRYINKIPCFGSCATYFSMTSDETAELPRNYFIRVSCHNKSRSNWHASVLMELYRERTHIP